MIRNIGLIIVAVELLIAGKAVGRAGVAAAGRAERTSIAIWLIMRLLVIGMISIAIAIR